jgi:regulation of enolase protein 1 (concanavalin A-like superfamily)
MKKMLLSLCLLFGLTEIKAQTLSKMQWYNEPEQWEIKNNSLIMQVTSKSDYWRISHYGFTVDDAPFYYANYGGELETK